MEVKAEKICSQKLPALKRYSTKFEWVLSDWSLLYDNIYSKGIKSDSFALEGIRQCSCRIFFNPKDGECHLTILFSHPALILAARVNVNKNILDETDSYYLSPVRASHRLRGAIPLEVRGIEDIIASRSKDTLKILVKVSVVPILAPSIIKKPATNILKKIKALFDDKKLCDVTLVLGNEEIPAHKAVLAAHSQVFEAMFSNEMTESKKNKIEIVDIDADVFQEFLDYLYTGEVDYLEEMVEGLISVADKYKVTELKTLCSNYMLQNLSAANVVQYLLIADKLDYAGLRKKAFNFLQNSPSIVAEAVKEGDPEVLMGLKKIFGENSSKD